MVTQVNTLNHFAATPCKSVKFLLKTGSRISATKRDLLAWCFRKFRPRLKTIVILRPIYVINNLQM